MSSSHEGQDASSGGSTPTQSGQGTSGQAPAGQAPSDQAPSSQGGRKPPELDATSTMTLGAIAAEETGEAHQESAVEGHTRAVEALPPGSALLVVRRGPNAGSRFLLDEDITTAGRHPESDIFLDDVTVSRRHAEFRRDDAAFSVRDVGSLNGTYVNRERTESIALSNADEVQIGKFRLVFLTGPRAASEAREEPSS